MGRIVLDGMELMAETGGMRTVSEVVDFVKTRIDPEAVIVSLQIDGKPLADVDWIKPLNSFGSFSLDVTTAERTEYIIAQLYRAVELVEHIGKEFALARQKFASADSLKGNDFLKVALRDFKAFIDWYSTVLSLLGQSSQHHKQRFVARVGNVASICNLVMEEQKRQCWWLISDLIVSKLEPELVALREDCEAIRVCLTQN